MKRTLPFLILLVTLNWASAGQTTTQLTFDDLGLGGGTATSGTYNSNDTFSFDVILTFSGYSAGSLTFWLETTTAFAGSLSITGETYGTAFPDHPTNIFPIFFNGGDSGGYTGENSDLGSSRNTGTVPPGSYLVAHITFAITGAAPGTYDLRSTTASPHTSEVSGFDGTTFSDHNVPATHYSITIVPEPATLGLLGLGAAGLAAVFLGRRKHARHALSKQRDASI